MEGSVQQIKSIQIVIGYKENLKMRHKAPRVQ